jgi:hypothetical protein
LYEFDNLMERSLYITGQKAQLSMFYIFNKFIFMDNDDVNGVRVCLGPAAINRPIVHPPGDMSTDDHHGMILTGKTPDLVIRALLQYHQQSSNSKAV